MDSFSKETHRYAFAMVNTTRTMPVDMTEKLEHLKQLSKIQCSIQGIKKKNQKKDHLEINFTNGTNFCQSHLFNYQPSLSFDKSHQL